MGLLAEASVDGVLAPILSSSKIADTTDEAEHAEIADVPKRYQAVLRTSYSISSSTYSPMESLDVENLSKEVVVSMRRERDGKENEVQYALYYRQGRIKIKKKRCVTTMR